MNPTILLAIITLCLNSGRMCKTEYIECVQRKSTTEYHNTPRFLSDNKQGEILTQCIINIEAKK